jgi:cytoskeletal protein CcmA (bactofilin family)
VKIILDPGSVTGEVICNADIEGKFNGVTKWQKLNVKAKASIHGEVQWETSVEPGIMLKCNLYYEA